MTFVKFYQCTWTMDGGKLVMNESWMAGSEKKTGCITREVKGDEMHVVRNLY